MTLGRIKAILFDLNETLLHQHRSMQSHVAYTYAAVSQKAWQRVTYEQFFDIWCSRFKSFDEKVSIGRAFVYEDLPDTAKEYLFEPQHKDNIRAILVKLELDKLEEFSKPSKIKNSPTIIRGTEIRDFDTFVKVVNDQFQESWVNGLGLIEKGIHRILSDLQQDYKLGLITNFQQADLIPKILEDHQLYHFFRDCIVVSCQEELRKPHPDVMKLGLTKLGIDAGEAIYVGDDYWDDYIGAKKIGMFPILIGNHGNLDVISIESINNLPNKIAQIP